ncbi:MULTISPECIES: DUF4180 domain-containing protein [unclassified Paenibacillus]|uniref:DUF4180 domain-containing protein n=1 Tax=unclassified Paenibacillus TaxID=185978 RepID=UPI00240669DB|nr:MULTISPECIES: DUF4180 domain-containing protein [unclassified Paenibacillus]MDF9840977.1 PadR family transcriptional regulator AphA [Paenibacillus sp. PastF-2]MDF9847851.1 PadR family transcriptional regulator AphA [Paenibacillus sp. PastM-2]MDF9854419.1 PadR family transcriptional regulator AphA [Paenibacillus sp. PastF-1]MDH6479410.1 PadR family transcriptional regulator AphA [Paenibacillus sp. PastH-2]MDH6505077.1 PadR family transcriptional regulator AphA [Paenibacillus sp. PastM-3]
MSINYAILGLLSSQSLTGYDLKKIIQDSSFMYWSGNNNQIYKALVELLKEEYVTSEVQHQESSPSKKIYTITPAGQAELKRWVLSAPEQPEARNTFLIQLAWSDQLETADILGMLDAYEQEIMSLIHLEQGREAKGQYAPGRSPREAMLWKLIQANRLSAHTSELQWIGEVRRALTNENGNGVKQMKVEVMTREGQKYLELRPSDSMLSTEQDILDLIGACMEHDVYKVLLHEAVLPEEFYNLRTGLAGTLLQKFMNYRVRGAAVIGSGQADKGRFKELLSELNKGSSFRTFGNEEEAAAWLLQND